jgi:hypothetical protein
MDKKANGTNVLNVILIVINVILLAAVIIIWMNAKQNGEAQTLGTLEVGTEPTSAAEANPLAADVKLCSSIDENYNCEDTSKFKTGSTIYMITTLSGFEQQYSEEGWLFGIRQNITTTYEDGNIVGRMTPEEAETAEFTETEQDSMIFMEKFETPLNTDMPGIYTLEFKITDRLSGKKITGQKIFEMES